MAGPSIAVLADDLTGAAEIAAIGKRHGLSARIFSNSATQRPAVAGLSVHDTDSRLLTGPGAASRVNTLARTLSGSPGFVYKKTDSVLRGNVLSECISLATALGFARILLVPANPTLGRTISQGQYLVQGAPLHETAFARDPHHPARSASVLDLLGPAPADWPVTVMKAGSPLPPRGIVVGEVASPEDVDAWARRLEKDTLPAGGADFFRACLRKFGQHEKPSVAPNFDGAALVISGSLTPARQKLIEHAETKSWPAHPMPTACVEAGVDQSLFNRWTLPIVHALRSRNLAICVSPGTDVDDAAQSVRIRENFGLLVQQLHGAGLLRHLVVEGGATAAAISEANDWTSFDVAGEWAPGVIALNPTKASQLLFTIKPGSYTWPESLWHLLDSGQTSVAKS